MTKVTPASRMKGMYSAWTNKNGYWHHHGYFLTHQLAQEATTRNK